jgi:hypothetical protein
MNNSKQSVYFLAKCATFVSDSAHDDKNDKAPIVLTPIGGQSPRGRNIVSGTVAESEGFIDGVTCLVLATFTGQVETEDGEIVDSYNFTKIADYDKKETVEYVMEHPLQNPLIATRSGGDVTGSPEKVKGNPRARRIRDREEGNPEKEKPSTKKERTS